MAVLLVSLLDNISAEACKAPHFTDETAQPLINEVTAESYKKECQEKNLPFGSMPVDFLSWHLAQLPERALLL